jgi:Mlc titration factor MtfA (ptsG expression regulator)
VALLWILAVPALVIAGIAAQPWLLARRHRKLREQPFPPQWRLFLRRNVPLYRALPQHHRRQLEQHIQVFLAEKRFVGCEGVEVTDEMRLMVAAQACVLLLNRPARYFPKLHEIVIYPGAFLVERLRPEPSGVLAEQRQVLSGESSTLGQIVLSWEDVINGNAIADDGRNVVIHEFAHQLDQEKGYANGAPDLPTRVRRQRWSQVMLEEFTRLQQQAAYGEPALFSYYGATAPAEFFAVISEVFFEQPVQMRELHRELYEELKAFYRVDPAQWASSE